MTDEELEAMALSQTQDAIAAEAERDKLRADLAAANARIMELERIEEVYRGAEARASKLDFERRVAQIDMERWQRAYTTAHADLAAAERLMRELADANIRFEDCWQKENAHWLAALRRAEAAQRKVERLREALVNVLVDIDDYERRNKLAPSPGKPDCWQSVTTARAALADTETTDD